MSRIPRTIHRVDWLKLILLRVGEWTTSLEANLKLLARFLVRYLVHLRPTLDWRADPTRADSTRIKEVLSGSAHGLVCICTDRSHGCVLEASSIEQSRDLLVDIGLQSLIGFRSLLSSL